MLVHNKLESSAVNGPGNRCVIWVAGCTLHCPGCWNPDTHAFDSRKEVDMWEVYEWILSLPDIEGCTFSGGEPMQQAPSLWILMERIHQVRPDFSFGMYTGYTLAELENEHWKWKSGYDAGWVKGSRDLWARMRAHMDFAIMGRYRETVRSDDKPLCGSLNQEVVFFTERYSAQDIQPQSVEMTIDANGLVQLTGFPVGVAMDDPLLRDEPTVEAPRDKDDPPGELVDA